MTFIYTFFLLTIFSNNRVLRTLGNKQREKAMGLKIRSELGGGVRISILGEDGIYCNISAYIGTYVGSTKP